MSPTGRCTKNTLPLVTSLPTGWFLLCLIGLCPSLCAQDEQDKAERWPDTGHYTLHRLLRDSDGD
ncbi:MAG: hypothetical protein WD648_11455 [Planctomycetaceae bacterium]